MVNILADVMTLGRVLDREGPTALPERLESIVDAVTWDHDEGWRLGPVHRHSIPQRFPTRPGRWKRASLLMKVSQYRDQVRQHLKETRKSNPDLAPVIDDAARNIHDLVYLDGPLNQQPTGEAVWHLVTPPLLLTKYVPKPFINYLPWRMQARFELDFPFGSNPAALDLLARAPISCTDIETQGWQEETLPVEMRTESVESLLNHLRQLNPGYAKLLPKKPTYGQVVRNINRALDEDRVEYITCAFNAVGGLEFEGEKADIVTTFPPGPDVVVSSLEGYPDVPFVVHQTTVKDLPGKTSDVIKEVFTPLGTGANQLKFDWGQLMALDQHPEPTFRPGMDDTTPKFVAQTPEKFVVQRALLGRQDLDVSMFCKRWGFPRNAKLDTASLHFIDLMDEKILTHQQLIDRTDRANLGDEASRDIIHSYGASDSRKPLYIAMDIVPEPLAMARALRSSINRVCTVGRKSLGKSFHYGRWWDYQRTIPGVDILYHTLPVETSSRFGEPVQTRTMMFDDFDQNVQIRRRLKRLRSRRGVHEARLVALHPIAYALQDLFDDSQRVENLWGMVSDSSPKRRTRILKALSTIYDYPAFALHGPRRRFEQMFEDDRYDKFRGNIDANLAGLERLQPHAFNLQREFIILKPDAPVPHYAVDLGVGQALSGRKGSWAMRLNGEYLLFGIADPLSNIGIRCPFEKEAKDGLLRVAIAEDADAVEDAYERLKMKFEDADSLELIYDRKLARDSDAFSANCRFPYIAVAQQLDLQEGDMVPMRPSRDDVRDHLFGEHGTLTEILKWAKPRGVGQYEFAM